MIEDQLKESETGLQQVEQCLQSSVDELNAMSQRLRTLRNRQKEKFGRLLLRTTLNQPLADLVKDYGDPEGTS